MHYQEMHAHRTETNRLIAETRSVSDRQRLRQLQQDFAGARLSMSNALRELEIIASEHAVSDEFIQMKSNIKEMFAHLLDEEMSIIQMTSELSNTYSDEGNEQQ